MIVRVRSNQNVLVEWLDFIHNYLIVNYKVTKNLPFDLFIQALISLKIKEIRIIGSISINHRIAT